jgi:hypothetical protein
MKQEQCGAHADPRSTVFAEYKELRHGMLERQIQCGPLIQQGETSEVIVGPNQQRDAPAFLPVPPLPGLCCVLRFYRLDRAHKGDDRIEIVGCHFGKHVIGHWSRQFGAVRLNALGYRLLDIVIAPLAKALVGIGCDVATDTRAGLSDRPEITASGKGELHIERLAVSRGSVAQHAMPYGRQIATIRYFILP